MPASSIAKPCALNVFTRITQSQAPAGGSIAPCRAAADQADPIEPLPVAPLPASAPRRRTRAITAIHAMLQLAVLRGGGNLPPGFRAQARIVGLPYIHPVTRWYADPGEAEVTAKQRVDTWKRFIAATHHISGAGENFHILTEAKQRPASCQAQGSPSLRHQASALLSPSSGLRVLSYWLMKACEHCCGSSYGSSSASFY